MYWGYFSSVIIGVIYIFFSFLSICLSWSDNFIHFSGNQWQIQDFPGGGTNSCAWGKTYYLARFLPKTAWKWKKLDWQGMHIPSTPLDLPMVTTTGEGLKLLTLIIIFIVWHNNHHIICITLFHETANLHQCMNIYSQSVMTQGNPYQYEVHLD